MFSPGTLAVLDEAFANLALGHYWVFIVGTVDSPWGKVWLPGSLERRARTVSASPSYLKTWV